MSDFSISAGLPGTRDDWPMAVLEASALFSAGDVVEEPPLFYFADPENAVWAATQAYAEDSQGPEIVDAGNYAPKFGVITGQTCDVGEVDFAEPSKPWVSISPVYNMANLPAAVRSLLKKSAGPLHWLHLPKLAEIEDGFWVADLRIEMPVEKGWLVGRVPIQGFISESAQRLVVERVAHIRTRPAWADSIVENVQRRLFNDLKTLRSDDPALFEAVNTTFVELGCKADSMLAPGSVLFAAFSQGEVPGVVEAWWVGEVDGMRSELAPMGITVQEALIHDLTVLPVTEYRAYAPVPITRFSPF